MTVPCSEALAALTVSSLLWVSLAALSHPVLESCHRNSPYLDEGLSVLLCRVATVIPLEKILLSSSPRINELSLYANSTRIFIILDYFYW